jgi:hypothetical protein
MKTLPTIALAVFTSFLIAACVSHPPEDNGAVRRLIDDLTNEKRQAIALQQLESMGMGSAPSIVKLMDDRRPLGQRYVEFRNKATNAFEAHRIYKPELVVDALAGLLNQMTAENFGYIYSGGPDDQRANTVRLWRQWCVEKLSKAPNACS